MKINAFPTRSLSLSLAQSTELLIYENTTHASAAVGVGVEVGVADWSGRSQTVWNHQLRAPLGGSLLGQICAQISCSLPSLCLSLPHLGCALKSYAFHTKSSSQWNDSRHFIRGGWSMARSLESLVCVCLGLGGFALVVLLSRIVLISKFVEFRTEFWQLPLGCIWNSVELWGRDRGPIKLIELFALTAD